MEGSTYKLKWPGSEHAIYITINDIIHGGHRRPFEVFINSKNMEHFAWTVALTRMISAVFRRGGDVSFVSEELKAVFDPRGGAWMQGQYIPSILAAIGGVIERHMIATGFIAGEGMGLKSDPQAEVMAMAWAPTKLIVWAGTPQVLTLYGQDIAIDAKDMRANVDFKANASLPLEKLVAVFDAPQIGTARADQARLALQLDPLPEGEAAAPMGGTRYRIGGAITSLTGATASTDPACAPPSKTSSARPMR